MRTKTKTTPTKATLCNALRAFIAQRSGINYANYGERSSFLGDYRPILRHGRQARQMLRFVEWHDGITAEDLIAATRAFSGRLQFVTREDGKTAVDYCTGQYFATEYRAAACAVLAQAIWDWIGNKCMPEPSHIDQETGVTYYGKLSAGDYIRKTARRVLGRSIAREWFD